MTNDYYLILLLLVGLLIGIETGRRLGKRYVHLTDKGGTAAADGVVFAMLGLLIAFTFTTSATQFNERRRLIIEHANSLNTVWNRLDLLDDADQPEIRALIVEWVRLIDDLSYLGSDYDKLRGVLAESERLQQAVWTRAVVSVDSSRQPGLTGFVLAPINRWMDLTTTRMAMDQIGLPPLVLPTLVIISLIGSVLAGISIARNPSRGTLHMLAFALAITFAIYVIVDLDNPRSGLIRVDSADRFLQQLEQRFTQSHPELQ